MEKEYAILTSDRLKFFREYFTDLFGPPTSTQHAPPTADELIKLSNHYFEVVIDNWVLKSHTAKILVVKSETLWGCRFNVVGDIEVSKNVSKVSKPSEAEVIHEEPNPVLRTDGTGISSWDDLSAILEQNYDKRVDKRTWKVTKEDLGSVADVLVPRFYRYAEVDGTGGSDSTPYRWWKITCPDGTRQWLTFMNSDSGQPYLLEIQEFVDGDWKLTASLLYEDLRVGSR